MNVASTPPYYLPVKLIRLTSTSTSKTKPVYQMMKKIYNKSFTASNRCSSLHDLVIIRSIFLWMHPHPAHALASPARSAYELVTSGRPAYALAVHLVHIFQLVQCIRLLGHLVQLILLVQLLAGTNRPVLLVHPAKTFIHHVHSLVFCNTSAARSFIADCPYTRWYTVATRMSSSTTRRLRRFTASSHSTTIECLLINKNNKMLTNSLILRTHSLVH